MTNHVHIVRHLPYERVQELFHSATDVHAKERIHAILELYEGKTLEETAQIVRHHVGSVQRWVNRWNKEGEQAFERKKRAKINYYLADEEWEQVVKEITDKGMTIEEVQAYVKKTRNIEYTYKGTWYALRKRMRVRYGKAYIRNSKRPADADAQLEKNSPKSSLK